MIPLKVVAFVVLPLVVLVTSAGYAAVSAYRLRDVRPLLFVVVLVLMAIHQTNELVLFLDAGRDIVSTDSGEYPETLANLSASVAVVAVLRLVYREQSLRRELSARVEQERELRERNERLDQFARIVSHDVRNPLNVAQGRLDMSRRERDDEHLAVVSDSLDRIGEIVEGTLELARQGQTVTDPEPVEFDGVAIDAWEMVETEDATLMIDGELTLLADRERVERLLENLFRNAIEHGRDDVRVRVGPSADGFFVADDGPGIAPDRRDEAFDAGHTTATDGSGFGLAIVDGIAAGHGWTVDVVESEAGGARFDFTGVERAARD